MDKGATAKDSLDGDVTVVTAGSVDVSKIGSYTITYNVTDSAGNAAAEVQRGVTVGETSIPVIPLLGEATLVHEAKSSYSDAGATASDTLDGNITDSLVTVSTVNINKVGEYSVSYNVVDANGNNAATVKRVVVVKDSTIPIIVINGENAVTHEAATNYND